MKQIHVMACEQCGGKLESLRQASTQGVTCAGCGWSVVTTHIPSIKIDKVEYEVSCKGDYQSGVHIRAVAKVAGGNYLASREFLRKGVGVVFVGREEEAQQVKNTLVSAGLVCHIAPGFVKSSQAD